MKTRNGATRFVAGSMLMSAGRTVQDMKISINSAGKWCLSRMLTWAASVFSLITVELSAQAQASPPVTATVPCEQAALGLPELLRLTLERNPRLAEAGFAVEVARGRAVQAGLYPNPTFSVTGDELGDRQGPGGIWTAPYASQEIVTAGKLKLDRAAAFREVDQATLNVLTERYSRFTAVRQTYFELLILDRRLSILTRLVRLAEQSVETTNKLIEAKQAARLDLLQLEVELERFRAEQEATRREQPAAYRRLTASVGVPDLPCAAIVGSLEAPIPEYDLEQARRFVMETHPEVLSAQAGVERARLLDQRARVEPIPNVTVGAGYVRQNQNKSDDWTIAVSVPMPLWNRNQGNISAAQAQVSQAQAQVGRAQSELAERLASAFANYAPARQRAERYRTRLLPRAREAYELSYKAYQGGQFDYLRVLQAQRAVAEADLEYNRSLGEAWRAASEIAGLLLEDDWPAQCHPASLPATETPR